MHFSAGGFYSLAIAAIFAQNIIYVLLLCSSSFFRSPLRTAERALYCVMLTGFSTLTPALGWLMERAFLHNAKWLEPLAFMAAVALPEVLCELLLRRYRPALREKLGVLLPESAFNCAVLGLLFLNIGYGQYGFWGSVYVGFCSGIGFSLAFFLLTAALRRTEASAPPSAFKGLPLALLTAGILSLAFMGFSGMRVI